MKRTETTVKIATLANGGDGVGKLDDGRIVFVPRGLPEDEVRIVLEKDKKRWARGRIVEVTHPSPHRISSKCAHFEACGGCAFQHLKYGAEFDEKSEAAREAMRRIAKIELPEGRAIRAVATSGYRIRARLHCDGKSLGYHGRGSHSVFALRSCPVLVPSLDRVLADLSVAVRGAVGEVLIETAGDEEVVVVLRGEFEQQHAEAVFALGSVRGVRLGATRLGSPEVDALEAWNLDADGALEAGRFRQANAQMGPVLRSLAVERAGAGEVVVEFFAGSGNFTHALAASYGEVRAYELDPIAVELGQQIAAPNTTFHAMNLDAEVPEIPAGSTVLLDPPRAGAPVVCDAIAAANPARVVYVSCDVATLARDTRPLVDGGLELASFDLVDMFPRTPHIEVIATFARLSE